MKNLFNVSRSCFFQLTIFTINIVMFSTTAFAQVRPWMPPANLAISATGTGSTTGHIATIKVTNNTNQVQQLDFGNFYIPSNGKYQSYVVPEMKSVEVPPRKTITTDVYGYCADIRRPPVEGGNPMPDPNTWLVPVNTIRPDGPQTFIVVPADVLVVERKPGQTYIDNVPVGYVSTTPDQAIIVDPDKNPDQAATFLLDAIHRISFTYNELQSEGGIKTPFSNNQPRERESVIQQTIWIYAAALSGDNYEKEQFAEQVFKQYESNTGRPIDAAPPAEKQKLDEGVDDFWSSFTLVGVEAKVISTPATGSVSEGRQTAGTDPAPSAKAAGPPTSTTEPKTEPKRRSVDEIWSELTKLREEQRRGKSKHRRDFEAEESKLEKELEEAKIYEATKGEPSLSGRAPNGVADAAKGGAKSPLERLADATASGAKGDDTNKETPDTTAEEQEPQVCHCGDFTMKLRVKKPDGSYDRYFDVEYDADPQNDDWIARKIDATGANIGLGEEVEFEISNIDFECNCEQSAPCDSYTPRRIFSTEPKRNAKSGSFKIHTRDEMCETVKNNEDNTKVTAKPRFTKEECEEMGVWLQYGFMVNQVCQTETCGAVNCQVYIFIRL